MGAVGGMILEMFRKNAIIIIINAIIIANNSYIVSIFTLSQGVDTPACAHKRILGTETSL